MPLPKLLIPGDDEFPDPHLAPVNNYGLLAVGGDLSPTRLMHAYQAGIFPWFSNDDPILWWSPDPRGVLFLDKLHISRSLAKILRRQNYQVTFNQAFDEVIKNCASMPRKNQNGTWITPAMFEAYHNLHLLGHAQSVEIWNDKQLVGGIYGIDLGHIFCGESMFSRIPNASKLAFVHLVRHMKKNNYRLLDCQMNNPHLMSLGVENIPRDQFLKILRSQ